MVKMPARLRDPVGAIEELIWNALDADAGRVVVELERNDLGGVERVRVADDGSGMSAEQCAEYSRASAGVQVRWTSVSEGMSGRQRLVVESDRHSMDEFDIGESEPTSADRGTLFEAFGSEPLDVLAEERTRSSLTAAFATYLEKYPDVHIDYDGRELDPSSEQLLVRNYLLPGGEGQDDCGPAQLKVIEWRKPVTRALFLCDGEGMSRVQLKPGIQAPGFEFTAHLQWSGFDELDPDELAFAEWSPDGAPAEVVTAAREHLRGHFRSRVDERRREQVGEWRKEGIYPYAGEPADERERAERETFDAVATTVVRHLPKYTRARRTTFALLRSVITHEPGDVLRIAEELFTLSKQEQEELARLLDRTPLSALVKAFAAATDRLDFLAALEHLVFDGETRKRVKEHGELHRILEKECWVFGEEYGLHVSDRSLDEVLRQHCRLLGREDLVPTETVLMEDGRRGRVDLMLSQAARRGKGERHHLVVELKRPSTVLTMTEFGQLNSYAQAVVTADRFRDTPVTWDFWLVGNSMDEGLRQLAHQHDRMPGCALLQPRFRIWVRTWGEIIEDCQERLRFYGEQLEYQASTEHAMDYLVREHADAVGELVAEGTIPPARSGTERPPVSEPGRAHSTGSSYNTAHKRLFLVGSPPGPSPQSQQACLQAEAKCP